jgi:hypothetical protein
MMIIFFWFCLFSDPLKQKRPLSAFFFNLKNEMMFFCFFFFWEKKQKSQLVIGVYNKEGGRDHHLFRVECVIRSNSFIFLWPPPQLSPQCQVKKSTLFGAVKKKRNWTFFSSLHFVFFIELFGNDSGRLSCVCVCGWRIPICCGFRSIRENAGEREYLCRVKPGSLRNGGW